MTLLVLSNWAQQFYKQCKPLLDSSSGAPYEQSDQGLYCFTICFTCKTTPHILNGFGLIQRQNKV